MGHKNVKILQQSFKCNIDNIVYCTMVRRVPTHHSIHCTYLSAYVHDFWY